nr:Zn(2+)-responsive transcriptional regulator [Saccharothrix mutabilis subsp. capreolus]
MTMRSGQLAQAAGVNPQTLRYYERIGLLTPAERTLGGHRLYPPEALVALRVIKAAQRLGFSLGEIAELLELRRGGLRGKAAAKLAEVEAKIADLTTMSNTLREAVDAGCDDLIACAHSPRCPLPFNEPADPALPSPG